jgi:hypothetical protein
MLKKSASFVLGSSKSLTYPRGHASGFDSPVALLNNLFDHPVGRSQFPQMYSYWISDGVPLFFRNLLIRSPTLEKLSSTP